MVILIPDPDQFWGWNEVMPVEHSAADFKQHAPFKTYASNLSGTWLGWGILQMPTKLICQLQEIRT